VPVKAIGAPQIVARRLTRGEEWVGVRVRAKENVMIRVFDGDMLLHAELLEGKRLEAVHLAVRSRVLRERHTSGYFQKSRHGIACDKCDSLIEVYWLQKERHHVCRNCINGEILADPPEQKEEV
jgi:hypothetical protein